VHSFSKILKSKWLDGRQPIYRISFPLLCLGALLSSLCQNITQLAIGRAIQAFGAASILSVGGATIGDIYRLEQRGTAMGIYSGVCPFFFKKIR
jgi:MFS family permease